MEYKKNHNTNPLVYIIMPCYNSEKYLLEQLMSIYYQNYTNWYLIFINDGSTDNSENIIRDWISHYNIHDKVKVINKENGGVNTAVQRGLEGVKELCDINNSDSLISYCDSDDVWTRDKLNIQVNYMITHPEYGLSYHNLVVIDENSSFKNEKHLVNTIYLNDTFSHYAIMGNHLTSTEMMFRINYIDLIIPMPTGFCMSQDKWTALVLLLHDVKFGYIDQKLGYYRSGHESMMKQAKKLPQSELSKGHVRYMEELQERFKEKDLSYFIKFNRDRCKRTNKGYPLIYIFFLYLFKYPWTYYDRIIKMATDIISKYI